VACGAVVGWLLWSLTASIPAALVVGAGVASILVVLAIAGTRQNETFREDEAKVAVVRARRQQVLDAMRETQTPLPLGSTPGGGPDPSPDAPLDGSGPSGPDATPH
jgi:hypothetical protein